MKLIRSKIIRNALLYFALLVGYFLLYVMDIEKSCYEIDEKESKSKVDFVYQQF